MTINVNNNKSSHSDNTTIFGVMSRFTVLHVGHYPVHTVSKSYVNGPTKYVIMGKLLEIPFTRHLVDFKLTRPRLQVSFGEFI